MAKPGVGTRTWRKTRERILRRDGYICQYCAQEADTRAEKFGIYFDGVKNGQDCDCCGDRWRRTFESNFVSSVREAEESINRDWVAKILLVDGQVLDL